MAQGRVADLVREERQLAAVVKGSEEYRVAIRAKGDALAARLRAQEREVLLRILLDEAAPDVELCRRIARRLPIA